MPLTRALLCLALPAALAAVTPQDFGGSLNVYRGSGGVSVITPSIHAAAELNPRTRLAIKADLDAVSAASFDYAKSKTHRGARPVGTCWTCHPPSDALSGATRNYLEVRRGVEASVKRLQGPLDLSLAYLGNRENDYSSDGASVGVLYSSDSANTTLGLNLSALFDRIQPVTRSFSADLRTVGGDLTLTQVLGPRTLALLSGSWAGAEGYLGNPYSFVQIGANDSAPQRTRHPDVKQRQTARLSLKQGLWRSAALQADGRYYSDSWDVRSQTLELALAQRVGALTVEPLARWQDQPQGASFYKDRYDSAQDFMTRDLKLAPHRSSSYGLSLRGPVGAFQFETRWLRYQRQDSADYSRQFADGPEAGDLFQFAVTLP